jgi:hypothetical protein
VTEYGQDRLFTMATATEIRPSFPETYQIEPLTEGTCRVKFIIEIDGAPKVAEFFMSQAMKKEQPKTSERLKNVLARKNR